MWIEKDKTDFISFLKHEKRLSFHTIDSYILDCSQYYEFIQEHNLPVDDHQTLRKWIVFWIEKGIVARTVNRKLSALKTMFTYLQGKELIEKNPLDKIAPLNTPTGLPSNIAKNDLDYLLGNIAQESTKNSGNHKGDFLIVEMLYGTGLRVSELINIKIEDIDLLQRTLKVMGKGSKERIVPLHQKLVYALKDYLENTQEKKKGDYLILTHHHKPLYVKYVYRVVKKLLGQVTSAEKKSPHVLRHSFATDLLNKGADLNAIKDILGHTSLAATQVYTHNSIEQIKQAYQEAFHKINQKESQI